MQKKYGFSTCLGGGERLNVQMGQLVALQLHPAQVAQLAEDGAVEGGQPVVVQVDVTQARQKRPLLNQLHTVEAHVQRLQAKVPAQVVVVANLVNPIVVNVQPLQRLGNEGKVEPLQAVRGHVEPLEILQRGHEAVHVLQLVVVEAQGPEILEVLDGLRLDGHEAVVGQIEDVEVGVVGEHLAGDAGQPVAGQPEAVETGQTGHVAVGHLGQPVLAEVQRAEVGQAGQGLRDLEGKGKKLPPLLLQLLIMFQDKKIPCPCSQSVQGESKKISLVHFSNSLE